MSRPPRRSAGANYEEQLGFEPLGRRVDRHPRANLPLGWRVGLETAQKQPICPLGRTYPMLSPVLNF
jgi:hypothetical protein